MPIYKSVDKKFFKKWTPDMAYILGFFSADGYITKNKRGGQFWCLDISDKNLILEIKKVIQSGHKIGVRRRNNGKHITYRLQIGSVEICEDLNKLGFDEKKTRRLSMPNIPKKYMSSFIRGYFDGDGNVWTGLIHKDRKTRSLAIQTVFTSCSQSFLEEIRIQITKFGIENGRIRKGKGDYYRLAYSIIDSLKLYDFMYNSLGTSKLLLKRKKDVLERFIKMRL